MTPMSGAEDEDALPISPPPALDKHLSIGTPVSPKFETKLSGGGESLGRRLSMSVRHQLSRRFTSAEVTPMEGKDKKRNAEVFLTRVRINALKNDVM